MTQRAYRRYFNVRVGPSESTINRLVANFRQQGTVRNLPGAGRRRTVHTDDNIELVFENEHGVAVSVKGVRYRTMLENFLRSAVENHHQVWFQRDGATAHTTRDTMSLLRNIFGERIISRTSDFNWPPRSPNLTAPDCFLWGYLKEKVHIDKSRTIEQLKSNIRDEINNITPEVLRKVMENVLERARICEAENGHQLRDIIFNN